MECLQEGLIGFVAALSSTRTGCSKVTHTGGRGWLCRVCHAPSHTVLYTDAKEWGPGPHAAPPDGMPGALPAAP